MHIPDLRPLAAKVGGLPLEEEDRVSSAQALMGPQTGLQDPPASGGWGSLPWGGLPGFMTGAHRNTSQKGQPRPADDVPRMQATTLRPGDPSASEERGLHSRNVPPQHLATGQIRTSAQTDHTPQPHPRRGALLLTDMGEPQTGDPFQSMTSDFIVFEEVDGKWVLQPSGLQMETGGPALGPAARTQEELIPLEHQTCTITPEKIRWIHTILNPPGLDLRGEGELARAMGEWGDGLSAGTQVFSPPDRLTLTGSRRDRCSRPHDRAGWALLHWYEQGLSLGPITPACTWCGHPATSGCETCATVGAGSTHPLTKCLDCAADLLLKGCRRCSGTLHLLNLPSEGGAQGDVLAPGTPAAKHSLCGSMCSRGPCTEQCNRESRHPITECACDGHRFEIDAGLFAEHIKDCLIMEGIDTAGMTNYDIGMTATRILKDLADGKLAQGQDDT